MLRFAVALVLVVLGTVALAAICAWFLAWNSCVNLLPGHRAFDFLCGHNAPLQIVPMFFLLLILFAFLSLIISRRWKVRRSPGANASSHDHRWDS